MLLRVGALPDAPLAAAAAFYAQVTARIEASRDPAHAAEDDFLTMVFTPADHTHSAWRLAAVQSLARALAPTRVNALESGDEPAIAATEAYLRAAPGVTGQLLALDGTGAGAVLS